VCVTPSDNVPDNHHKGGSTMHDMLTAFHLVRYFELREKEREPYREFRPQESRFSLALWLSRKLHSERLRD
jgi:hypothetical protein